MSDWQEFQVDIPGSVRGFDAMKGLDRVDAKHSQGKGLFGNLDPYRHFVVTGWGSRFSGPGYVKIKCSPDDIDVLRSSIPDYLENRERKIDSLLQDKKK